MMSENTSKNRQSCGCSSSIASIVFIVFLVLKLTNNIDWSWIWVLSPLWISGLVAMGLLALFGIVCFIDDLVNKK
jgi:hypothetical protein